MHKVIALSSDEANSTTQRTIMIYSVSLLISAWFAILFICTITGIFCNSSICLYFWIWLLRHVCCTSLSANVNWENISVTATTAVFVRLICIWVPDGYESTKIVYISKLSLRKHIRWFNGIFPFLSLSFF